MKFPPSYISSTKACRILWLAILLLVIFDVLSGYCMKKLFNSSSYNFSREIQTYQADTLILGSSTAARGLNPVVFDHYTGTRSYSFAKDGTGIFYATSVLKNIQNTQQLRYVIFGIDPNSFATGFSSPNFRQIERLLPYANQDALLLSYLRRRIKWLDIKLLSTSYPYISVSKEIFKDFMRSSSANGNGFKPLNGVMSREVEDERGTRFQQKISTDEIAVEASRALSIIRNEVQARGAKLILVTTPVYKQINRSQLPRNKAIMSEIRRKLSGDHLCDLSSFETPEINKLTFNRKNFYDSAHLNNLGAEKFTEAIAKQVNRVCAKGSKIN